MASEWKTHPLYRPRLALLINAIPSLLLALISVGSSPYSTLLWIWHVFLAIASGLMSGYELLRWGTQKVGNPDAEPKYPIKRMMILDIILAIVFAILLIGEYGALDDYYSGRNIAIQAYASVTAGFATVIHFHCFWKQFMARKKAQWQAMIFSDSKPGADRPLKTIHCPHCNNAVGLTCQYPHGIGVLDRAASAPQRDLDLAQVDIEAYYKGTSAESETLLTPRSDQLVSTILSATNDAGTHAFGYGTLTADTVKKMKVRREKSRHKGKGPARLHASLVDMDEQNSS